MLCFVECVCICIDKNNIKDENDWGCFVKILQVVKNSLKKKINSFIYQQYIDCSRYFDIVDFISYK